ncbi:hypothetical protein MA16_Dca020975 [Dendrobium catenatum]|uniref:Uncharacterized protein n=1 Tax=Dendrobium catenatum TaxID=906689 RepID=A0A2I0V9T9_9ASPA|nr:hypothetical protein MA16_Dca020975 [Dendrobium catenatum]
MVEFEREKIFVGFKGVWREFHMVAPKSLHLSTIRFKVYLEKSFGKKKISLVLKDSATPPYRGSESDSRFSSCERNYGYMPYLGG